MRKNDGLLWAIFIAAMLVAALSHAQRLTETSGVKYVDAQNKHELLIGLPEAQNAMIEKYASEGATTDTLAALYLCELAALTQATRGVVKQDDGTTVTVWVQTYAAWDMFVADMLATIAMEQGYRGQGARWPVWLRESGAHLTGERFMELRGRWFGK